jgi:hypothetical protein
LLRQGGVKTLILYLIEMKRLGLIADYAIGGATALIYYFEPMQTQDIDVFVVFAGKGDELTSLAPLYGFLKERGATVEDEYVIVHDVPVQFLVPYNPLVEEAVAAAVEVPFEEIAVRIPPLEHLMAIMVQTGRGKDKARLEELMDHPDLFRRSDFDRILEKYDLTSKWKSIQEWLRK